MIANHADSSDAEERLLVAIDEYYEARRAGSTTAREECLSRHPDLEGELRRFFEDEDLTTRVFAPIRELVEPHPTPDQPRMFGKFELLQEIGRGGMGVVHRARDRDLGRVVAVKILFGGPFASEADRLRFKAEVSNASQLVHPNIARVYGAGEAEWHPYYDMELIEGQPLGKLLAKYQNAPNDAAALLERLARIVQYAHDHHVLHRDLKPNNVLIDEAGEPHIVDFGLSKYMGADATITQSGIWFGTPGYMAPEQLRRGDGEIGWQTDVYGLGAILYALLTGKPPFVGDPPSDTPRLVLNAEPTPPRIINRRVDAKLEAICLKCLAKDPADRYATAADLADDLRRYLDGAQPFARPQSRLGRILRSHWRRGLWIILLVVAGGSITGFLVMGMLSTRTGQSPDITDKFVSATAIPMGPNNEGKIQGALRDRSDERIYRFTATADGPTEVRITPSQGLEIELLWREGRGVVRPGNPPASIESDSSKDDGVVDVTYPVKRGVTYYLCVRTDGFTGTGTFDLWVHRVAHP